MQIKSFPGKASLCKDRKEKLLQFTGVNVQTTVGPGTEIEKSGSLFPERIMKTEIIFLTEGVKLESLETDLGSLMDSSL